MLFLFNLNIHPAVKSIFPENHTELHHIKITSQRSFQEKDVERGLSFLRQADRCWRGIKHEVIWMMAERCVCVSLSGINTVVTTRLTHLTHSLKLCVFFLFSSSYSELFDIRAETQTTSR